MSAVQRIPMAVLDPPDGRSEERSVGELFTELARETGTLIRQEVQLATTEMTHKATYAGRQVAFIAAGGLFGVVSMLALVGALVLGLGTFMPLWMSALLVGVVMGVVSFAIAKKGMTALREMDLTPKQTIQSIQEDKSWVQQQIR